MRGSFFHRVQPGLLTHTVQTPGCCLCVTFRDNFRKIWYSQKAEKTFFLAAYFHFIIFRDAESRTRVAADHATPDQLSADFGPAAGPTSTGIPVSRAMPDNAQAASGPSAASRFTFTPSVRLATDRPRAP